MQKRFNSQRQKQSEHRKNTPNAGQQTVEIQILLHKIKALEAKLLQQTTISETLRFHNEEFDRQVIQKNETINKLKLENAHLKNLIADLEKQMEARKKSAEDMIRQIRQENSVVKQKNVKMCEIVRYLEVEVEEQKQKSIGNVVVEQGLRKRVEQLTLQNENMRRRMAKSEVESQKFKLKALEGEKYWSSKLEKSKNKENETLVEQRYEMENKHKQEVVRLKADVFRYQKMLKIKEEQIGCLQRKIEQLLTE